MSKKLFVVIGIVVAFFLIGSLAASAQDTKRIGPATAGPDLAAVLQVEILSKTDNHNGRIRLIGSVKNVGKKAFQSTPDKQYVYLYGINSTGQITQKLVDGKSLPILKQQGNVMSKKAYNVEIKPGQEIRVFTYDMDFNASAVDREFSSGYKMHIVFGPDLDQDKLANDDRNVANNEQTLTNKQISDIFYRTAFDAPSHGPAPKTKK